MFSLSLFESNRQARQQQKYSKKEEERNTPLANQERKFLKKRKGPRIEAERHARRQWNWRWKALTNTEIHTRITEGKWKHSSLNSNNSNASLKQFQALLQIQNSHFTSKHSDWLLTSPHVAIWIKYFSGELTYKNTMKGYTKEGTQKKRKSLTSPSFTNTNHLCFRSSFANLSVVVETQIKWKKHILCLGSFL